MRNRAGSCEARAVAYSLCTYAEDVTLIPKRVLATLLLTKGNTVDSVHLSPVGHMAMVELLLPWLGRE